MREILFKAKSADNGEWVFGDYGKEVVHTDNGGVEHLYREGEYTLHYITPLNEMSVVVSEETVCQFIQEVNKHRIFENDIVKAYKHGDLETQPFIYPIEYRSGTYWFGNWTWLEFLNVMRFVEVVGK